MGARSSRGPQGRIPSADQRLDAADRTAYRAGACPFRARHEVGAGAVEADGSPLASISGYAGAMTDLTLAELVERIVLAGVALTTRALAEAAPQFDLSFPQWRVLVVLGEYAGGATISEVAGRIGVTIPATSRQLRRLQRRALVDISPDEQDRRASRARLTPSGRAARDAILIFRRTHIETSVADVVVGEETLMALTRLATALGAYR